MYQSTTLKIVDDISVTVPDSLNLITTYVLAEQGDWFEDEIKFVRTLLKPGQKAIDIGANYGLFTLSMAKVVGPQGKIWAFEPASSTAAFLSESLVLNGFSQVTLDQRALSDKAGTAQLSLNDNSELNELVRDATVVGTSETVELLSLDDAMAHYKWSDIDFVKIDAEGEEAAIIRGGKDFFRTHSPLVQYEVKAGNIVHLELIRAFADIGYSSYRLVPGLDALVPFGTDEAVDGYLLNLFCCKADRAAALAKSGRLVIDDNPKLDAETQANSDQFLREKRADPSYSWQQKLTAFPYGKRLADIWLQTVVQGQSAEVENGIALHCIANDSNLPLPTRFKALKASFSIFTRVCAARPYFLRYVSLARVAREFGARVVAVNALSQLYQNAISQQQVSPSEPFLAASERFEAIDPSDAMANWIIGSVLEELERNGHFSSFYSGQSAIPRLQEIQNMQFGSPEMTRRLELVRRRFPS